MYSARCTAQAVTVRRPAGKNSNRSQLHISSQPVLQTSEKFPEHIVCLKCDVTGSGNSLYPPVSLAGSEPFGTIDMKIVGHNTNRSSFFNECPGKSEIFNRIS